MPERIVWAARLKSERFGCSCLLTVSEEVAQEQPVEPGNSTADAPGLIEDRAYWYSIVVTDSTVLGRLVPVGRLIKRSPRDPSEGVLSTQSQAGILRLEIELARHGEIDTLVASIDVYPAKFDLLAYRSMVADICRHSLALALRLNATTAVPLHISDHAEESGIAQRYFFIRHLLGDAGFQFALEHVASNPHTRIERELSSRSMASARRLDARSIRALASGRDRVRVPLGHALERLGSLPRSGVALSPVETPDTPENRFVRFALIEFSETLSTVATVCGKSGKPADKRIADDAARLNARLKAILEHPTFRDLGESSILPLGSPVLHKRAGYREIFEAWLQFHIAASLSWEGSADVFDAGRRDTDKLYEYWLFFQLLDVMSAELGLPMPRPDELISESAGGFLLQLKAGRNFVHEGETHAGVQPLTARFSYNRTFSSSNDERTAGSWSVSVRPDFTVSFWPAEIDAELAEQLHLVVHLHFDAKYRVDEPSEDGVELLSSFRREDLFVAHTYRDAIRRSWGAFVIYPGDDGVPTLHHPRFDAMPAIGAFPVKPTVDGQPSGIEAIGRLIKSVLQYFGESFTSRERLRHAAWMESGRGGDLPGGGVVLVPDVDCCVPLSSEGSERRLALRLSDSKTDTMRALEAWRICGSMLVEVKGNGESDFFLASIVGEATMPAQVELPVAHGQPKAIELCVIVSLNLGDARTVIPKSPSSMVALRRFAKTYLGCCATPDVLKKFVVLS